MATTATKGTTAAMTVPPTMAAITRAMTTKMTHKTMVGPVGSRAVLLLMTAPLTPARAPKRAESPTIVPRRSVHCRAAAAEGNERAALALELFCHRIIHYVGAYHALLPSLDAIVFTGGIGENCHGTRGDVCRGLASLGVKLDEAANLRTCGGAEGAITTGDSAVSAWVVPTDEELMIARDTHQIVAGSPPA